MRIGPNGLAKSRHLVPRRNRKQKATRGGRSPLRAKEVGSLQARPRLRRHRPLSRDTVGPGTQTSLERVSEARSQAT